MFNQLNEIQRRRFFNAILTTVILLAVFIGVKSIGALRDIDHGEVATNVISISGTGKVVAVPDTGMVHFSVIEEAKTVAEAQDKAANKTNAAITALKALGILEKDIETTGYNSYPKYDYRQAICPPMLIDRESATVSSSVSPYYCPPSKQTLTGYEVSQSISVKIRKTADAGAVLTKIGTLGVTNISGLDFVIDDIETAQAQARDKAIHDAKAKAKVLAKSLGVRLGKIVSFDEGGRGGPVYYSYAEKTMDAGAPAPTVPQIPVGEDEITSSVTITYEIN